MVKHIPSKWFFGLNTSDYGGGCDEGVIYDNLDAIACNGADYIRDELHSWQEEETEGLEDDEAGNEGFENALSKNIESIVKTLVDNAKAKPDECHTFTFGAIGSADDAFIIIRPADEDDIEIYPEA